MIKETVVFEGEYIQLNQLLKCLQGAASGGEAKLLIEMGLVKVNGTVATEIRKKLKAGDKVKIAASEYTKHAEYLLKQ